MALPHTSYRRLMLVEAATSEEMASLAGRLLQSPHDATDEEVKKLAASVLVQRRELSPHQEQIERVSIALPRPGSDVHPELWIRVRGRKTHSIPLDAEDLVEAARWILANCG